MRKGRRVNRLRRVRRASGPWENLYVTAIGGRLVGSRMHFHQGLRDPNYAEDNGLSLGPVAGDDVMRKLSPSTD